MGCSKGNGVVLSRGDSFRCIKEGVTIGFLFFCPLCVPKVVRGLFSCFDQFSFLFQNEGDHLCTEGGEGKAFSRKPSSWFLFGAPLWNETGGVF